MLEVVCNIVQNFQENKVWEYFFWKTFVHRVHEQTQTICGSWIIWGDSGNTFKSEQTSNFATGRPNFPFRYNLDSTLEKYGKYMNINVFLGTFSGASFFVLSEDTFICH